MNSYIINFDDKAVVNTDLIYNQLKKLSPNVRVARAAFDFEEFEDEYLLALALERKKLDTGIRYTWEEVTAGLNITQKEIDETEKDFE